MEVDLQVIKRYLEGKERAGDKELILDWFSDIRAETDLRKKYRDIWDGLALEQHSPGYEGDRILNRIYHDVKLEESRTQRRPGVFNRFVLAASKVAAVLFIPLVVYLCISRSEHILSPDKNIAFSEIYSPLGTRTMFYLPDGSKGWLNGGSYLEFPTKFTGESRQVSVKGEAYFEVTSDPDKPFIVSGSDISVTAYGTSFNVRAYPEDRTCEITLVSGSIKAYGKWNGKIRDARMLQPDQMYTYDRVTARSEVVPVNAYRVISWKDGKLIFKNDPLSEVVKRLNRWYNVNITIGDNTLESYVYLATFEDETLEEVLKLLKLSAPIKYKDFGRKMNNDGSFEKRKIVLYYRSEQ